MVVYVWIQLHREFCSHLELCSFLGYQQNGIEEVENSLLCTSCECCTNLSFYSAVAGCMYLYKGVFVK